MKSLTVYVICENKLFSIKNTIMLITNLKVIVVAEHGKQMKKDNNVVHIWKFALNIKGL